MRELIVSPRRKHSQKPDEQYERIERFTDVQRVVHERLREAGAVVAVAHGIDQALAQLEAWNSASPQSGEAPGAHSPAHHSKQE